MHPEEAKRNARAARRLHREQVKELAQLRAEVNRLRDALGGINNDNEIYAVFIQSSDLAYSDATLDWWESRHKARKALEDNNE